MGLKSIKVAIALYFPVVLSLAQPAQVHIPQTETFRLSSENTGREYQILVALPEGYDQSGSQEYPVLVCLDANAGFGMITQIYRYLRFGEEVPELLIIGIGYPTNSSPEILASRSLDFTPTQTMVTDGNKTGGDASRFLDFIQNELLIQIKRNYRVIDDYTLAGHSHGGLFATFAMFQPKSAFDRFIIGSPSLWYDNRVCFDLEEEFARNQKDLPASVFWCYGSQEGTSELPMGSLVEEMVLKLERRQYPGLRIWLEIFKGDTHFSSVPSTYSAGLRYLFALDPVD